MITDFSVGSVSRIAESVLLKEVMAVMDINKGVRVNYCKDSRQAVHHHHGKGFIVTHHILGHPIQEKSELMAYSAGTKVKVKTTPCRDYVNIVVPEFTVQLALNLYSHTTLNTM